jgi:hypothetical protein
LEPITSWLPKPSFFQDRPIISEWRGGFCVPTDVTANPAVLPTASHATWTRVVVIECL